MSIFDTPTSAVWLLRLGTACATVAGTLWALHRHGAPEAGMASAEGAPWLSEGDHSLGRLAVRHGLPLTVLMVLLLLAQRDARTAESVQGSVLVGVLYLVAIEDLRTLQVPLAPLFLGMLVRAGCLAAVNREALVPMVLGLFTGAGMLTLVGLAYEWLRGRPGLGPGDAAVLALIGSYVGWQGLISVLLAGAGAGLLVGGSVLLLLRRPLDTPMPFAPCLAAGGWTVIMAQASGWLPRSIGLG